MTTGIDRIREVYADEAERHKIPLEFFDDQEIVEAGSPTTDHVPILALRPLRQIRTDYDPEGIQELADRIDLKIDKLGRVSLDVIHPITVGRFDRDGLMEYLRDHSDYYGLPTPSPDEFPIVNGTYNIPISGHRRRLAILLKCEQNGIPADRVNVAVNLRPDIDFETAHSLQSRENTHRGVSPIDDAEDIERYFNWQTKRHGGQQPSVAQCARAYGFSRDKIRDALQFVRSPEEIRRYAVDNVLPYGMVVSLGNIYEAYVLYYARKHENSSVEPVDIAAVRDKALDETIAFIDTTLIKRLKEGVARKRANEIVHGKLAEVRGLAQYQTGELFILADAEPARKRQRVRRELADTAIGVIGMFMERGELSDRDIHRLQELLARQGLKNSTDDAVPMFDIA